MSGPQTPHAEYLHASKYRATGESFEEGMNRVASPLTDNRAEFLAFREPLLGMRFLPGGRIQAAVGSPKQVTPYNCFVSGEIHDSFIDGHGSIMKRATQAAQTMRLGGGIGYDFSSLRPRGATIKKLGSVSSGPVAFMGIFDAICKCIASSGHRRGAQMGILRVDHPDIEEFIHAKQNDDRLTGFNLSIGVTDEFMIAVRDDQPFRLRWKNEVYATVNARALWEKIMRSTWDWAEPGVIFVDRINDLNNLWYCELIAATNPCGEQPLPPYGACLLGSFNLVKYLRFEDDGWNFDWDLFRKDIPLAVRAMDRVIDVATYPMYEQEQEAHNKRRMGLGVTGLANAGETLGHPYGSDGFLNFEMGVFMCLRDEAYRASALLAQERGSFPLFDRDKYLTGKFISTLPEDIRQLIMAHGIRNSHLLSVAPTGTISLTADNVSSGIEPVFSTRVRRTVQTFEGPQEFVLEDYAHAAHGVEPRAAETVTAMEHLRVLALAQQYVDSSVSKTCTVSDDMEWEDFKQLYSTAWELGCKGLTTFNPSGKRMGIIKKEEEESSCRIDSITGRKECD